MRNLTYLAMLAVFAASTYVHALESAAGNVDVQNATTGLDARLNASNVLLQTAINQILTCNNKGMIFASDTSVPGRDADGCVAIAGTTAPEYYFAKCASGGNTAIGSTRTNTQLVPASAWPSGYDVNYSVVQSNGSMPVGTYTAMGYCQSGGATLWRKN